MAKYKKKISMTLKLFKATYKPYGHGINILFSTCRIFCLSITYNTNISIEVSHLHQKAPVLKDSQTIALQFGARHQNSNQSLKYML